MAEQTAPYDHIGRKDDAYAQTATLKRAEKDTCFRMVGALEGKSVLDLACGCGFYTKLLKQRGAAQVLGVDISPEMVHLARAKEPEEPEGIASLVYDAAGLPRLGRFDLVTAVYLLNYVTSTVKHIGGIATPMAWSSGWSARSDRGRPPGGRGPPGRREAGAAHVACGAVGSSPLS